MTEAFRVSLKNGLKEIGLALTERQMEQLYLYYTLVVEKNKVMNLTAITEEQEFVVKHILDSLCIAKLSDPAKRLAEGINVLDLGTGAGIPGVILAVAFPESRFVLVDSLKKRLRFIEETVSEMEISNVVTCHARAEDAAHRAELREQFELVVSRAVAGMPVLCEYAIPFVKAGGCFAAYKSGTAEEEILGAQRAVTILGGKIESTVFFSLPGSSFERSLAIVRKVKQTPQKYPRKAGTPSSEPL